MNSRYSPFVIRREPSWNGAIRRSWRGLSLSYANPVPEAPTDRVPPANETNRSGGAEPWRANRQRVETARRQLEIEVAELHAIAEAQRALVEYVESGGGSDDEGLDRMLCRESALRTLCADLVETFGR